MDWISNHLQLVIFIAGVIAYWLNQTKKGWDASKNGEAGGPQRGHTPAEFEPTSADNEDRIRQIQDEIRRKIAERRGVEAGQYSGMEPPPLFDQADEESPALYSQESDAKAIARQNRLVSQLAEAERAKAAAKEKLHAIWDRPSITAAKRTAARQLPHALSVRETLHDRKALQRAWIMREVLEKPVGLR